MTSNNNESDNVTGEGGSSFEHIKWVHIYTVNTEIDAKMFKDNLESVQIPVQILSQVDSTRMFTVGSLAIVKLFVPSDKYAEALEIIKNIEDNIEPYGFDDDEEE
jgi:hypothetical protein